MVVPKTRTAVGRAPRSPRVRKPRNGGTPSGTPPSGTHEASTSKLTKSSKRKGSLPSRSPAKAGPALVSILKGSTRHAHHANAAAAAAVPSLPTARDSPTDGGPSPQQRSALSTTDPTDPTDPTAKRSLCFNTQLQRFIGSACCNSIAVDFYPLKGTPLAEAAAAAGAVGSAVALPTTVVEVVKPPPPPPVRTKPKTASELLQERVAGVLGASASIDAQMQKLNDMFKKMNKGLAVALQGLGGMSVRPTAPTKEQVAELAAQLDANCKAAGQAISDADVIVTVTGAGFSADSGLAVYKDIATVPAYQERKLTYAALCEPKWLKDEPELFYGFWGGCFNDYRNTEPHAGFAMLAKWRDAKNGGEIATAIAAEQTCGETLEHIEMLKVTRQNTALLDEYRATAIAADPLHPRASAQKASTAATAMGDSATGPSGSEGVSATGAGKPYNVTGNPAGAFFLFTSNVDAHSFDHFNPAEIRECHGNIEVWQCGLGTQCAVAPGQLWRAPADHCFPLDKATMLVPTVGAGRPGGADASAATATTPGDAPSALATIGNVAGSKRKRTLRNMPGALCGHGHGFAGNHPVCPSCGAQARPAILMFSDGDWIDDDSQKLRYTRWREALVSVCDIRKRTVKPSGGGDAGKGRPGARGSSAGLAARGRPTPSYGGQRGGYSNGSRGNAGGGGGAKPTARPVKVVVIEIGAGGNVTTCRRETESVHKEVADAGGKCTTIRINPDLPLADNKDTYEASGSFIGIQSYGLAALRKINKHVKLGGTGAKGTAARGGRAASRPK